jgi:AcrR family transcriptional regulator
VGATTGTRRGRGRPRIEIDEASVFDAAARAFAESDLFCVTMDDIAERAGLSKPVLYRRFGSKEDVFAATVDGLCDDLEAHLFAAYARAKNEGALDAGRIAFGAFLDYAEACPHGFRLLFLDDHAHSEAATRRIERLMSRLAERVADLILGALALKTGSVGRGAADALGFALVGFSVQVALPHVRDGRWDRERLVDLLADFMRAGLLGVDASGDVA